MPFSFARARAGALAALVIATTFAAEIDVASNGGMAEETCGTECYKECNIVTYMTGHKHFTRTDEPKNFPGYHGACVDVQGDKLWVKAFRNGLKKDTVEFSMNDDIDMAGFRAKVAEAIKIKKEVNALWSHWELKQEWGIFAPKGERMGTMDAIVATQSVVFIEGGQFMWPGVKIGHMHTLPLKDGNTLTLETLSMQPLVFSVRDFLHDQECDEIISLAGDRMFNSGGRLGRAEPRARPSARPRDPAQLPTQSPTQLPTQPLTPASHSLKAFPTWTMTRARRQRSSAPGERHRPNTCSPTYPPTLSSARPPARPPARSAH
jgi:hypothetical protein